MATRIQIRRDTAANWLTANPILALGELCWARDTKVLKIGDGVTAYNSLEEFTGSSSGGTLSDSDIAALINNNDSITRDALDALFEPLGGGSGSVTDASVAALINNAASDTHLAIDAEYATKVSKGIAGSSTGDVVRNAISFPATPTTDQAPLIQQALDGHGYARLPPRTIPVASTIKMPPRSTLEGVSYGTDTQTGTVIVAMPEFAGNVIETENYTIGDPNEYAHGVRICNLNVRASAQVSGNGIAMKILGELATIDTVFVGGAYGHGILIEGAGTPAHLGWVSVHGNGRDGTSSGVYWNNQNTTHGSILRLDGDNNGRALLHVRGLYRATMFVANFKAERWGDNPRHPDVFLIENGNGGMFTIGSGRIQTTVSVGANAIIKNIATSGNVPAFINVLGAIQYDSTSHSYAYDYEEIPFGAGPYTVASPRGRGRPISYRSSGQFHTLIDGASALDVGRINSGAGATYIWRGRRPGDSHGSIQATEAGAIEWGPRTTAADSSISRAAANRLQVLTADLSIGTAGRGLRVREGTDAKQGVATLVAGTVTVANTSVTANSRILLTPQTLSGVSAPTAIGISARTAGTSFTITSASSLDTSVIAYQIFEPA